MIDALAIGSEAADGRSHRSAPPSATIALTTVPLAVMSAALAYLGGQVGDPVIVSTLHLFAASGLAGAVLAGLTAMLLTGRAAAPADDSQHLDPSAALDDDMGVALFDGRSDAANPSRVVANRVSANFRRLTGLPDDTRIGLDTYFTRVHPDDLPRVAAEAERVTRECGTFDIEHRLIDIGAGQRWMAARGSVTPLPDGGRRMLGVIADITSRKAAERRLSDSEVRLRLAIEAAQLGTWVADIATGTIDWSPRMLALHGLDPEGATPDYAARTRFVHPDDRVSVEAIRTDIWKGQEPVEYFYRVLTPDGTLRHLHGVGRRVEDPVLGINRVAGIIIDETARVEAAEELADSEARARFAAEAAGLGVFAVNTRTGKATWSERMREIYGLDQSFEPTNADEFFARFIHPEDRSAVSGAWHGVKPGAKTKVIKGEFRAIRADGAVVQIQGSFIIPAATDTNAHFIYGFHQDVTETRALRAQALISGNLATLGQMAASIAHEIGQPLQVISLAAAHAAHHLGTVQGPAGERGAIATAAAEIERIGDQVDRTSAIISHLLAFSRGESSQSTTHCATVVNGALRLVRGALQTAGVEIAVDLPPDLPDVRGGQVELEQVLINLFFNARDAMAGRAERHLMVRARTEGEAVLLEVEDTGGGIPTTLMTRVFDPFFTTKELGKGTGLGLAICRTTMESCGGSISAANAAKGALFTLRLARAAER